MELRTIYTPISDHQDSSGKLHSGIGSGNISASASDLPLNPEPVIPDSPCGVELEKFPPTTQADHSKIAPTKKSSGFRSIFQSPGESVHHYWARFLLAKSREKRFSDQEIITTFSRNFLDKGILNAFSRRQVRNLSELSALVQKYCTMESTWQSEQFFSGPTLTEHPRDDRNNRILPKWSKDLSPPAIEINPL